MKTTLLSRRTLLALALVVIAVGAVAAQTVANGPYYALPSWAQKLPSSTRFIVLANWNNEAVLDRETGLVWERAPDVSLHLWASARGTCIGNRSGDRMGWRLPSIVELMSLRGTEFSLPGFHLPSGHPFLNVHDDSEVLFWSATAVTFAEIPAVWVAHFGTPTPLGATTRVTNVGSELRRWCVRGPMTADAY